MSYSEFTKELLDILDLNLTFHEDAFRKERINDETCFVFDGTLTYQPEECFHCPRPLCGLTNSASNVNTVERLFSRRFS
ncbi:hypothetical protein [Enterococcus faecium]|uniref:hypothetical protein n=1 Tax=Enterococcus faecium TaxID=1352 RepID=UPI0021FD3E95|nr:hypothetical protein [Enterococcus faecium]BDP99348.1 hypothetical protein EfmGK961_31640 [Enterococcus faecium]